MSIEFVEPEPALTPTSGTAPPAPAGSAGVGRWFAATTVLAGLLAVVGSQLTLYEVVRTASIVDFDGTTYRVVRVPVSAFGVATPTQLDHTPGLAMSDITTVQVPDGISYGPWWTGLGVVLLLAGVWGFARPRSTRPAALVAAAGGALLGSLGAAWLATRAVSRTSVPQISYAAAPALGLWVLLAAAALAVVAGLLRALTPGLRRPTRGDVHDPGPTTA